MGFFSLASADFICILLCAISDTVTLSCNTADNNAIKISDNVKGRKDEKQEKNEKQKHMAFKYSNEGTGDLHETIILAGKPAFVKYDSKTDKLAADSLPFNSAI